MRTGPHFYPPPKTLVSRIEARVPGFWRALTASVDRATRDVDVTLVNWFRDAGHNARVGGQPNSQHRWATALDLSGPGARVAGERLKADGWKVLDEGDHVHVQAFDAGALTSAGIEPG